MTTNAWEPSQPSFLSAEQKLEQTITDPNELRKKRDALYNEKGRRFFGSYELAMRHHQAIQSDKAVFERFQHFWGNHFAIVDKIKLATFNTGAYQRQTIRNQMDKRFADLVMAATLSFPMMRSLDNFLSRGPNSKFSKNKNRKKKVNGLNENHGRELLELHTVSPMAGYSQKDVINAAYILTGWGMWDGGKGQEGKKVSFHGSIHEPGNHTVLGKTYKSKNFKPKIKDQDFDYYSRNLEVIPQWLLPSISYSLVSCKNCFRRVSAAELPKHVNSTECKDVQEMRLYATSEPPAGKIKCEYCSFFLSIYCDLSTANQAFRVYAGADTVGKFFAGIFLLLQGYITDILGVIILLIFLFFQ